jgi:hypothetical protein
MASKQAVTLADVEALATDPSGLKRVLSAGRRAFVAGELASGRGTVAAAYATYAWEHFGDGPSGSKTMTAKAWGQTFSSDRKPNGVTESTVSLWRNLGKALVDHKIDPESDLFRDLAFSSSLANRKAVKALITDKSATVEQISQAVEAEKNRASGGNQAGQPETTVNPVEAIKTALKKIRETAAGLSRNDFSQVEDLIESLHDDIVKDRTEAGRSTRKRAAKKATADSAAA